MEAAKIVLLALAIFGGYGAVFGEICVWISPAAYTVARANAMGPLPLAVLGPLWGIFDFLIFAAGVGVGTAFAAHVGDRPAVKAFFFRRPMLLLLPVVALLGALGGFLGYQMALGGRMSLPHQAVLVTTAQIPSYVATWYAMLGSQIGMIVGGAGLAVWTWRKRAVFEQMVRERGY